MITSLSHDYIYRQHGFLYGEFLLYPTTQVKQTTVLNSDFNNKKRDEGCACPSALPWC